MQSRFSIGPASFLVENQKHPLAGHRGRMLALLGKVAYCLDQSVSKFLPRSERRITISGVSYQMPPRFAHKKISLSQISAKKTQVGDGKHLKTADGSEFFRPNPPIPRNKVIWEKCESLVTTLEIIRVLAVVSQRGKSV